MRGLRLFELCRAFGLILDAVINWGLEEFELYPPIDRRWPPGTCSPSELPFTGRPPPPPPDCCCSLTRTASRHFFTKFLARFASFSSLIRFRNTLMVLPSLVVWKYKNLN